MTFLLTVLIASLLGSVHCAAMCGPFACLYSTSDGNSSWQGMSCYHVGRLISYLLLGLLAGAMGLSLNRLSLLTGRVISAELVAGLLMVIWGGVALLALLRHRSRATPRPALSWIKFSGSLLARIQHTSPAVRGLAIGLLTTLLPCGWLYVFVVAAGGTGSPLLAATVMLAFWIGTLPILTLASLTLGRVLGPLRSRIPLVGAATVLTLGLLAIAGHFGVISLMPDQLIPHLEGADLMGGIHSYHR